MEMLLLGSCKLHWSVYLAEPFSLTYTSLPLSFLRSFSYRDQLAMLSESMMKERKECAIRGKAQNQVSQCTRTNYDNSGSLRERERPLMYCRMLHKGGCQTMNISPRSHNGLPIQGQGNHLIACWHLPTILNSDGAEDEEGASSKDRVRDPWAPGVPDQWGRCGSL